MIGRTASGARPAVATTVLPGPRSWLQRKCACGSTPGLDGECVACRKTRLQRQPARQDEPTSVPSIVHDVLRSPGQPLDPATRAFMEPRLGHDFSRVRISAAAHQRSSADHAMGPAAGNYEREAQQMADRVTTAGHHPGVTDARPADFSRVRVHTDAKAAESARAVNALAYTVGRDVVFGAGRYAPATREGQRLLAHELTHVVQQDQGGSRLQRWGMDNAPIGDPERDPRLRDALGTANNPRTLEVTAIDDVDAVGWIESFLTLGEVNFTDINSMVDNILTAIGTSQMRRLNIQVHGSPSAVAFGNTVVSEANFASVQSTLARLSGHFTSGGFVHLRACDVGQNPPLMRLLAATFGVPTYAGRGRQSNIIGVNFGYIVRCEPSGTCTTQFFQP